MISRLWHGWTTRDNADRMKSCYAARFCQGFIASRDSREHCCSVMKDDVEFVTLTVFEFKWRR